MNRVFQLLEIPHDQVRLVLGLFILMQGLSKRLLLLLLGVRISGSQITRGKASLLLR